MYWLKQSTAATVKLGPFLDDTDGKTAETGLTISQADIRLSKNGGAFAQTNNAAGATHDEAGWYGVPLDTTDTATLGRLVVAIHESGALPVWVQFMVLPAVVFDSLVAGSDYLQVDAVQIEGGDATDAINAACDTAMSDYDAATGAELAAVDAKIDTIDGIVDAIVADTDELQQELADGGRTDLLIDAILADTNELQADDTPAALAALDAKIDTIDGIVDAIVADTDELQQELADGGRTDLLIDAILADTNELQADDTPAALAALDAKIDTIDGIVDDIVADTNELQTDNVPGLIAALNDLDAAGVRGAVGLAAANLDAQLAALPTDEENADAVWDEGLAGHLGAGSTGEALNAAGAAGDPWVTALPGAYGAGTAGNIVGNLNDLDAAGVRGAVGLAAADLDAQLAAIVADTDEVQAELADGGRTDLLIDAILADTNELQADDTPAALAALDAKIDTIDGIVDAIVADTDELQQELADGGRTDLLIDAILADTNELQADDTPAALAALDAKIDTIDGIVDAIVADTNELQTDNVPGLIAALNDPSAADVADAVWDEALAGHLGAGSAGAALDGATAPTAADVADAVWDEALAGHLGAGSTGEALNAAGAAGDPWITNLPGAYGPGSAGYIVGNNLDEPVSDVPAEVWENPTRTLTQSAASVAAAVAGSQITVLRGDTLSASLTGLGALTGYVSLDFTVKRHKKATDAEAIIRIRLNATGVDDGLLRLNGAAAATPANGSITIDDMAAGDITIALEAAETKELLRGMYHYDVQVITATGVSTLTLGTAEVVEDVTRLVA